MNVHWCVTPASVDACGVAVCSVLRGFVADWRWRLTHPKDLRLCESSKNLSFMVTHSVHYANLLLQGTRDSSFATFWPIMTRADTITGGADG